MMDAIGITVGVACYNEQVSIVPTIVTTVEALSQSGLTWEVIIMDDASKDDSVGIVRAWIAQHPHLPVRHHLNEVNRGLEWNVFEAAKIGRGDHFWMVAGDNAVSKETYQALLSHVGEADIIIPWVLEYRKRKLHRKVLSRLYVKIVNLLSGHRINYYNGSSIYRRSDIAAYAGIISGFSYSAELIMQLIERGRTFVEVRVIFNDRVTGKSSALAPRNFVAVGKFLGRLALNRLGLLGLPRPELRAGRIDHAGLARSER